MTRGRNVRYVSPRGNIWHLHGEQMGEEGVILTSFAGLYHPVRLPITMSPAYMRGAIPGPPKTEVSRIGMKIFTSANSPEEWEEVESRWWNDWSDEADGTLIVESLSTGTTRWQPVRLEKYPDDPFDFEPEEDMDWTMPLMAYDPGWRGPLLRSTFTGTSGPLLLANPGDVEVWPHFAGDPGPGTIQLPDGIAGDKVPLPVGQMDPDNGSWLVVTDQLEVPVEDELNSQVAALMAGMLFRNPIPPGTWPPVPVQMTATNATTVRATVQSLFERPWG